MFFTHLSLSLFFFQTQGTKQKMFLCIHNLTLFSFFSKRILYFALKLFHFRKISIYKYTHTHTNKHRKHLSLYKQCGCIYVHLYIYYTSYFCFSKIYKDHIQKEKKRLITRIWYKHSSSSNLLYAQQIT